MDVAVDGHNYGVSLSSLELAIAQINMFPCVMSKAPWTIEAENDVPYTRNPSPSDPACNITSRIAILYSLSIHPYLLPTTVRLTLLFHSLKNASSLFVTKLLFPHPGAQLYGNTAVTTAQRRVRAQRYVRPAEDLEEREVQDPSKPWGFTVLVLPAGTADLDAVVSGGVWDGFHAKVTEI